MKIYVTGLGLISAAGEGEKEILASFEAGKRRAGPVSLFSTEIQSPAYEVKSFSRHHYSKILRTLNLCLAATEDALNDASLMEEIRGKRIGVAMGTSVGSVLNDIDFYREFRDKGSAPMDSVNLYLEGNLSSGIHSFLETEGPSITVVNACASGTNAIGVAMSWLRTGLCDIAIAGGADELNKVPFCGFGSLGILSDSLCSPFDLNRNGLNLGEGAGVLLLESERSMKERKKKPRAIMRGYDFSNDAHHLTSPDPSGAGLERAITGALIDANLEPDSISFINAHGTATIDNDLVEARILYNLFGSTIAFLSTKGYTGHTLAAAGALEAGFCILALEQGWIPGCAGFKKLDPDIPIAPVTQKTQIEGHFALSTSMGFGGCDAALVIESPEQEGDI